MNTDLPTTTIFAACLGLSLAAQAADLSEPTHRFDEALLIGNRQAIRTIGFFDSDWTVRNGDFDFEGTLQP